MSKKKKNLKKYQKVIYKPDAFYRSYWFAKFINKFMRGGKKHVIERIAVSVFSQIKVKMRKAPLYIFFATLIKVRPLLGIVSKRFGKQFRKIPVPLHPRRQTILALKWLVLSIKVNRFSSLEKRMTSEFVDLAKKRKTVLWKRYLDHLVEINNNRMNNRFRWEQ